VRSFNSISHNVTVAASAVNTKYHKRNHMLLAGMLSAGQPPVWMVFERCETAGQLESVMPLGDGAKTPVDEPDDRVKRQTQSMFRLRRWCPMPETAITIHDRGPGGGRSSQGCAGPGSVVQYPGGRQREGNSEGGERDEAGGVAPLEGVAVGGHCRHRGGVAVKL
jgi:hypothetical protein